MLRKAALLTSLPLLALNYSTAIADETRNFEFQGFTEVVAQTGVDVTVNQGDKYAVEVIVKDNKYFEKLDITQNGNALVVQRKKQNILANMLSWNDDWSRNVQINVTTPVLEKVESNSGADVRLQDFKAESLHIVSTSGADVDADGLSIGQLKLSSNSGANLNVNGECKDVEVDASSGADVDAKSLSCSSVHIDVSTGADVSISANGQLFAGASAGGSATVYGNPENAKVEQNFGGEVTLKR